MVLMFARLIGALSSYGKPGQIAFAMAIGLTLAFIPGGIFIWFILFIPMMLFRINQAALIGMMAVSRLIMPYVDPLSEKLGFYLLNRPVLYNPMGGFLSLPMVGWLRLDDSFIFGSTTLGIAGYPFWFVFCLVLVILYRKFLAAKIKSVFQRIGKKVPIMGKLGKAVSVSRNMGLKS
jgi:uncharacterized protein (TIGR03546 family)